MQIYELIFFTKLYKHCILLNNVSTKNCLILSRHILRMLAEKKTVRRLFFAVE